VLFAIACVLVACASSKPEERFELPGQTRLKVDSIQFRGVEAFDVDEIKSGLVTKEDPGWRADAQWLPLVGAENQYWNPIVWERDKARIETFYKSRGYFAAKIASLNVQENRSGTAVRVVVTIDEGKPATIRSMTIDGLEPTRLTDREMLDELSLGLGDVFVEADYLKAKDTLLREIRRRSFAYAKLRGRVVIDEDLERADVFFFVDPGPACEFGEIRIEGLEKVDEQYVNEAVAFEKGEAFRPELIEDSQAAIYDLGVFSVVKVAPAHELGKRDEDGDSPRAPEIEPEVTQEDASAGTLTTGGLDSILNSAQDQATERVSLDPVVPVVIRLKEARVLNVRVGAGIALETQRAATRARADWSHRNFLGGLRKLEHFNTAGYAWADKTSNFSLLPNFADPSNRGVTVGSQLRFTQPQFFERLTSFNANLEIERDVAIDWTVFSPSLSVGLRRTWFRHLRTDISYNASLFRLSNLSDTPTQGRPPSEYIIEYLEQRFLLDYRNDVLNPTGGWSVELVLQQAAELVGQVPGIPGSDFDYLLASIGGETYFSWKLGVPQVLATRVRLGSIYNVGREALAPLPQRLYGGGGDSIRSFGTRRLSLYTTDGGEAFPIGGFTKAEASIEPRFRLVERLAGIGDLWGALYLDAATILPGQFLVDTGPNSATCSQAGECIENFDTVLSSLVYGVGTGVWWLTPIGPVRFDFAYTLSDTSTDPRFRQCPVPTDERGVCPAEEFVDTEDDKVQETIARWNIYIGIGHTF
jgi:translocation and assembly module TamA